MYRTKNIPKVPGIYQIKSNINGKTYVGSSISLNSRKRSHFIPLKNGNHSNQHLQRHYNKYGEDSLSFSVICICNKERLLIMEQYYIDIFNPKFNICKTAGNHLGFKHSEETKEKMRKPHGPMPEYQIEKMRKPHSRIGVEKMRLKKIGSKHSEETKEKMRIAHSINPLKHSDESKKKISIGHLGNRHSEESIALMREKRIQYWNNLKNKQRVHN